MAERSAADAPQGDIAQAYDACDRFIDLAKEHARLHPFLVVVLMHEYFRTLYPHDPYISRRYAEDHLENIRRCLATCIGILEASRELGSYWEASKAELKFGATPELPPSYDATPELLPVGDSRSQAWRRPSGLPPSYGATPGPLPSYVAPNFSSARQDPTLNDVFGTLWAERAEADVLDSTKVLAEGFARNGFDPAYFTGKRIVDLGCGSGRFTLAVARLGAASVVGVDLGATGLDLGTKTARQQALTNARFVAGSVLRLPFRDEAFDFAYCKGVLHHTGDLWRGLDELCRVIARGGKAFLYLYGSGGLFWHSRRRMREVMQLIPMSYTVQVLRLIGMPARRTIFVDSWYVPIEEHVDAEELEHYLTTRHAIRPERWTKGRPIELESVVFGGAPRAGEIWGQGELRYLLHKE